MKYELGIYPNREQLMAFAGSTDPAPIVMVNLLKFREVAEYKDGREEKISGHEAYMRYGADMAKIITARGGRILIAAALKDMLIGSVDGLWDEVVLVEYPSAAAFFAIATSPEVMAIAHHREAGLEGQLLIRSTLDQML